MTFWLFLASLEGGLAVYTELTDGKPFWVALAVAAAIFTFGEALKEMHS